MTPETSLASVVVAVPSVGRPQSLIRCLKSIAAQEYVGPLKLIVIAKREDRQTRAVASDFGATVVDALGRGVAGAYESAIEAARGNQIVMFTDDDAAPHPDWVSRVAKRFAADPALGAVGGRDILQNSSGQKPRRLGDLGKVTLLHGIVGQHEWGGGKFRRVDHLKGVNMAFRVDAVVGSNLGQVTEGEGAQFRSEFILSLLATSRGWTMKYDPEVLVDHFHAPRASGDERANFSAERVYLNMRNLFFGLTAFGGWVIQVKGFSYAILRGDRRHPGLLLLTPLLLLEHNAWPLRRFALTIKGIRAGFHAGNEYKSLTLVSP